MAGPLLGRGGRSRYRPMSEINVTPFVDVMLVLLIIFMVAAPLMTVGVPVDLPRTNATPLNQEQEPLTISVDSAGRIFLQETEVPIETWCRSSRRSCAASPRARAGAPHLRPRRPRHQLWPRDGGDGHRELRRLQPRGAAGRAALGPARGAARAGPAAAPGGALSGGLPSWG
jgi:biopolymer transport protein TolR